MSWLHGKNERWHGFGENRVLTWLYGFGTNEVMSWLHGKNERWHGFSENGVLTWLHGFGTNEVLILLHDFNVNDGATSSANVECCDGFITKMKC